MMLDGTQIAQWIGVAYVTGLATAGVLILIRERRLEVGDVSGMAFPLILGALGDSQNYHPKMRANPDRVN